MMVVKIKKDKTQKSVIKKKFKFVTFKRCLEATQLENIINHLENIKADIDSIKQDHKEFIRNNKLILKIQQRFNSERYNVFTPKINNIFLSSNADKRMQSIDLIETYTHRTSKDLVSEKEEIECNNTLKRYKN